MVRRRVLLLAAALLTLCPAAAEAGTLSRSADGNTLTYTAQAGRVDGFTLFHDIFNPTTMLFIPREGGDDIEWAPGSQCGLGPGSGEVACAYGTLTRVVLQLGDGRDQIAVDSFDPSDSNADFPLPVTIVGGSGADKLTGGHRGDLIRGGQGSDALFGDPSVGTTGNDVLDGGGGADTLDGVGGSDQLRGGNGADRATYASSSAGVKVNLAAGSARGGLGIDALASIERVQGSPKRDVLLGSSVANRLAGGGGSDNISGRRGNDRLLGQGGSDRLRGGSGRDVCSGGADLDLARRDCERVRRVP